MQRLQSQIYAQWKDARVSGRSSRASNQNLLQWSKRSWSRQAFGHEQSECIQLDKKNEVTVESPLKTLELDELYWFIGKKSRSETRENVYLMTMVNREPRQIVGFEVQRDKSAYHIQNIVDGAPWAEQYCTDGYFGYLDVVFPGEHVRNVHNKKDTFTAESINADLRHYIPVLARRSRCFCRKLETLQAVVEVFVDAYNRFGSYKSKHRIPVVHSSSSSSKKLRKYRDCPLSLVDFL